MKKHVYQFFVFTMIAIMTVLSVPSGALANEIVIEENFIYADYIDSDGIKYLIDDETGEHLPIVDVRDEITEMSLENPRDLEQEADFEELKMLDSVNVNSRSSFPVPGDVGYGFFYTRSFQHEFTETTAIVHSIVCPTTAGGNNSDFLYLTSTNRAAKGVEAFVSYYGQDPFRFRVFDWARPENSRWQTLLTYSQLSNYLRQVSPEGALPNKPKYQSIHISNYTTRTGVDKWTNTVYLKNINGTADLVYSYTYSATLEQQRDNHYGSWGPIVETFQDNYSNVNTMGFSGVKLFTKKMFLTVQQVL